MKRSPLNIPRGNQAYNLIRHTPYSWKSHNANKGYHSVEDDRNHSSMNNEQLYEDNFIPLNASTPSRHYKKQITSQYIPSGNHNKTNSGWSNHRNNHHVLHGRCNNRYSVNRHFDKQFYGNFQKRKGFKRMDNEQTDILAYIHPSFFEDPWENLVKSKEQDNTSNHQSLSDLVVANLSDSVEKSDSKLSTTANLDDFHSSQKLESKSVDTSFESKNTNVSQTLTLSSSLKFEINDTCNNIVDTVYAANTR